MKIIANPNNDSRGESNNVESTSDAAESTKSTGTTGYPQVLYGRSISGRLRLNTITEAVVIP